MASVSPPELEAAPADFVAYLTHQLRERSARRRAYSLRAYARDLGVDHSLLSKILRRERPVTQKALARIADRLSLPPRLLRHFAGQLSLPLPVAETPEAPYWELPPAEFEVISQWYSYALFECLRIPGVAWTTYRLARAVGVTHLEASLALDSLRRLGVVELKRKVWRKLADSITTTHYRGSTALLRRLQRQVLQGAIDALDSIAMEKRDQTSLTMAIDVSLLPLARQRAAAFRRELSELLQSTAKPGEVYHLSISLYPVTQISEKGLT